MFWCFIFAYVLMFPYEFFMFYLIF